ncbi:MAG: AmmeMemoRadiSam system radical SAM enzyme [Thermoguttaceae bacterium]|jgi:AmmeMemoRadiSam system radical SAM enzyme/AmmeMemoRadiSam system protein B/AmmeMemoRadiSam system protein A
MGRIVLLPPVEIATAEGLKPGGWWHDAEDGKRIVCDLCPRFCALAPGQRGFCFVRQNLGGRLMLTTYGRSTGFCIDPIEKKPLNHFYPGTPILSFGTAGCNLGCKFCQNWSISKSRQVESLSEAAMPEAIAEAARRHGCGSVAFTYNDPIIWAEYAIDTARACHAAGIKTVAVTSGYMTPEARKPFYEVMDAANVDLKAFTETFYRKLTSGHLDPVCDTLRWLVRETGVWIEITTLIIPRENDSDDELKRMSEWIVEELGPNVPLHFSAFHPDFRMMDRPPTPPGTLLRARELARRAGINYVYTGNIDDPATQSTYCHACQGLLIERSGYRIGHYAMSGDRCGHCQTEIPGRFSTRPGTWGSRRQPVRIASFARPLPESRSPQHQPANQPISNDGGSPQSPDAGHRTRSQGESAVALPGAASTAHGDRHPEKPMLDRQQEQQVFEAAGRRVAAAVRNLPGESMSQALAAVAEQPLLGAFVSLKRSGQLRSCCGFMGQSVPLGEAIEHAAFRAAKEDPRFPPISPTELAHLDMEVWLLWGLRPVEAKGEDRARAVAIGRHGLQIAMGNRRGLLLPGVATEHKMDAVAFLEAVCRKAGLPSDAWKKDDATLMTFEGYSIEGRLADVTQAGETPVPAGGPDADQVAELADFARQNLLALCQGAVPSYYLPGGFDGNIHGLVVTVKLPQTHEAIHCSRVNVRPEIPLQSTLLDLLKTAASALQSRRIPLDVLKTLSVGLTVLWDPAMQGTLSEPVLEGVQPRRRAVLAIDQGKWSLVYHAKQAPRDSLQNAAEAGRFLNPQQVAVFSLETVSTETQVSASNVPQPQKGPDLRAPAVAGRFYPGSAEEISKTLDGFLDETAEKKPWAAAMVPHAGWVYSGRLAARVLNRVEIPDRVIVFSPKHNRLGADWAVAPHRVWSLPSGQVKSDPELAGRLAAAVTGMELDAASHEPEHAIEVQLPILARLAPGARVVGVAMHGGQLDAIQQAAAQMAALLADMPRRPLLVISTDMNHYADDQTTRRLDRLALDAIESLDPAGLYETVSRNRITMCGVVPAVFVLETLKRLGALDRAEIVGYATSADASGDTSRVVGYAGALFG